MTKPITTSEFVKKQIRIQAIVSEGKELLMKYKAEKISGRYFAKRVKQLSKEQDDLIAELKPYMENHDLIVSDPVEAK